MRHRKVGKKLGRDYKHTRSILRNLALNLIKRERIQTTRTKAKALRGYIEKMITRAKVDSLHNRRIIHKNLRDTKTLKKFFENIAQRFVNRPGGYTRVYLMGKRKGDASEMALIEFVEGAIIEENSEKEKEKESIKSIPSKKLDSSKKEKKKIELDKEKDMKKIETEKTESTKKEK